MFTVKTTLLLNAIEAAAVGGGKGFVLLVSPKVRKYGSEKIQLAAISSSDGEKTAQSNFAIHTDDMTEDAVFYPSAIMRQIVSTLSKVTDVIKIDPKESYLELSDVAGGSVIRVPLLAKDIVLELPDNPEGATVFEIDRKKFIAAVQMGGYSAQESSIQGVNAIAFKINPDNNTLAVMSRKGETACRAESEIKLKKSENPGEWHLVNHVFIRNMIAKLTGEKIQVAFTPKYIMAMSDVAVFGSKKLAGSIPKGIIDLLNDTEYEYCGKLSKKDLLLGIEIATVGCEKEKRIMVETNADGSLGISSFDGGNRTKVSQAEHEDGMPSSCYMVDFLKQVLAGTGEQIYYFGKKVNKSPLHFAGTENGVKYASLLAPVNVKGNKKS